MSGEHTNESLLDMLKCSLDNSDFHICKDPISLSCGDIICRSCCPARKKDQIKVKCGKCGEYNKHDLNQQTTTKLFKSILELHIGEAFKFIFEKYKNLMNNLESNVINSEESIDLKIDFIKDEIDLRVESLKNELDSLKESAVKELQNVKEMWNNEKKIFMTKSNIESFDQDFRLLQSSIEKNAKLRQETLYEYQDKIKALKQLVNEFQSGETVPGFEFQISNANLNGNFIGNIKFKNRIHQDKFLQQQIMNRVRLSQYNTINLNGIAYDICVLGEDKLVSCDYANKKLHFYDSYFNHIRTIEQLDVISMDTNKTDTIYLSCMASGLILKTNMNFQVLQKYKDNSVSDPTKQMTHPYGLCYNDGKVYVCNYGKQSIIEFDENLTFIRYHNLAYSPWYVKIINSVACVRDRNPFIHFHHVKNDFQLIKTYYGHNGIIGVSDACFYEYNNKNNTLYVYDNDGKLREEVLTNSFGKAANSNGSICLFNSKLVICDSSTILKII